MRIVMVPVIALLVLAFEAAHAQRLKDIASVAGVRPNALIGYGLVVGLDGTGDQTTQTPFTIQTFRNMLRNFGIQLPDGVTPQLKNVAAVSVHAELPAFAKPGQTLDVTVSSLGNARSLRGGTLLMTPLKAVDGEVYALAQGSLVVGGFGAEGLDGSRITVNVPSVGRIPGGASVERTAPGDLMSSDHLTFNLHRADFTNARRVAQAINDLLGPDVAQPLDSASVKVSAPPDPGDRVVFVSVLENLEIDTADAPARVVINSRTGTIVIGSHVEVRPAAVTHGGLTVTISENPTVSQPNALSGGQTAVVPGSTVRIDEEGSHMFEFAPGASLQDIVQAVNDVGAAPGDLMAILEALRKAGALRAELVVI